MSQTVNLVLENISQEVKTHCDSCLKMLNEIPKWNDADMDDYIQQQIEQISVIKNSVETEFRGTIRADLNTSLELKRKLDKTLKNVTNIVTNINTYHYFEKKR